MKSLQYFKDIDGKPAWVECMTGIGPKLTTDPAKAARFETQFDAAMSPMAQHRLCLVEIVDAPEIKGLSL